MPSLLVKAAERGHQLATLTAQLMRLLIRYGAHELDAAIREALDCDVPHHNAVPLALDHRCQRRSRPPPVMLALLDHVRARDQPVRLARLAAYDLFGDTPEDQPQDTPDDGR